VEARHILVVDIVLVVVLEVGIGREVEIVLEEETVLEADIDLEEDTVLVVEMEEAHRSLAEVVAANYLEAAQVVLRNLA